MTRRPFLGSSSLHAAATRARRPASQHLSSADAKAAILHISALGYELSANESRRFLSHITAAHAAVAMRRA